jgi:hypothetical protein
MPDGRLAPNRYALITVGCLLLGLSLRAYHYLRQPPVWHDEAALIVNVIDKDYAELLGPLRFDANGPPLFLWLERAVYLTLGDSPLALRLIPFVASCTSLALVAYLARRILPQAAVPWAVLLFACSEQMLWHTCEAKPYAVDVFVAVLLATVYCVLANRPLAIRILALTMLAPIALLISYPAALVYGGLLATLGFAAWRQRSWSAWVLLVLLVVIVAACFGWVALVPGRAQQTPALVSTWTHCFADWQHAWTIPTWAFLSFLEVCRYCCKPLGQTLAVLLVIGGSWLWRRGQRDVVLMLTVPILLALVAALAHRYPFGGVRVMAYAAPAVILQIAAGVQPTLGWLWTRFRPGVAVVLLLLFMPVAVAGQRVIFPWQSADPAGAARYVEAHRLSSDRVIGNDWTHSYYFHHLGGQFATAENGVTPSPNGRVWVVVTTGTNVSREDRLHMALSFVPVGWIPQPMAEFSLTTVVLASRP